jgi:hypothetical protein
MATLFAVVSASCLPGCNQSNAQTGRPSSPVVAAQPAESGPQSASVETLVKIDTLPVPKEIPDFVHRGISWLVEAQHKNGGWGGGSHANQSQLDPHTIKTDPATTAFAAMALLRTGHTPSRGDHQKTVLRATEYLLGIVESASEEGPKITDITGTQPQAKLGPIVDTSMTAQFLARVLPTIKKKSKLHSRTDAALDKCLTKLQASQKADGSWNVGGGWAPVLQSSLSSTALELAQANGKKIQRQSLSRARAFQNSSIDKDTGVAGGLRSSAGIELYAFSSAQRANAADASSAERVVKQAKADGKIAQDAPVSKQTLQKLGVDKAKAKRWADSVKQKNAQLARLDDDRLLAGFGNNGGEEFLSYLMTSESLVISGGKDWTKWNDKMHSRLTKIQNADGSWNGHHCISSPVFCTAAVVQCLTSDRDAITLARVARQAELASVD